MAPERRDCVVQPSLRPTGDGRSFVDRAKPFEFKSLKRSRERAYAWLRQLRRRQPSLFAHWTPKGALGRTMGAV